MYVPQTRKSSYLRAKNSKNNTLMMIFFPKKEKISLCTIYTDSNFSSVIIQPMYLYLYIHALFSPFGLALQKSKAFLIPDSLYAIFSPCLEDFRIFLSSLMV